MKEILIFFEDKCININKYRYARKKYDQSMNIPAIFRYRKLDISNKIQSSSRRNKHGPKKSWSRVCDPEPRKNAALSQSSSYGMPVCIYVCVISLEFRSRKLEKVDFFFSSLTLWVYDDDASIMRAEKGASVFTV